MTVVFLVRLGYWQEDDHARLDEEQGRRTNTKKRLSHLAARLAGSGVGPTHL